MAWNIYFCQKNAVKIVSFQFVLWNLTIWLTFWGEFCFCPLFLFYYFVFSLCYIGNCSRYSTFIKISHTNLELSKKYNISCFILVCYVNSPKKLSWFFKPPKLNASIGVLTGRDFGASFEDVNCLLLVKFCLKETGSSIYWELAVVCSNRYKAK